MDASLVDVEERASDSINPSDAGAMPTMLSFRLGRRPSFLKPKFSKGVVMSSGIAGTDMSLDELTAHINYRVNGIDPNSRPGETPLAELDRVWKAHVKPGTKVRRNTTASIESSKQDFISSPGGSICFHSLGSDDGIPPSEIPRANTTHATTTARSFHPSPPASPVSSGNLSPRLSDIKSKNKIADDGTRDLHRKKPPSLQKSRSFYIRATDEESRTNKGLLYELIKQRKATSKSMPGSMPSTSSTSAVCSEQYSPIDAKTGRVPLPPPKALSPMASIDGNVLLCNDPESAAVSSPRTLRVLELQRSRKRSVSFSFDPDVDLASLTSSSSLRAGRNVDNEEEVNFSSKFLLGQERQQPQDLPAGSKAKVSNLVVKLPELDLSKAIGISSKDAASCFGPQRLSLRRTNWLQSCQ